MSAVPTLRLQFGDTVQMVGSDDNLDKAAAALGDSLKELNETHFIPLLLGLFLGLWLGPSQSAYPVSHNLRGRGLRLARSLWRWYWGVRDTLAPRMAHAGKRHLAFREFGIALFFAAVGLDAGGEFFATVLRANGVRWLLAGACVTIMPLFLVGVLARTVCRMNFTKLSGLLAGSTTNPPALAFTTNIAGDDTPAVAYAALYPRPCSCGSCSRRR
jgi:putative transport protein